MKANELQNSNLAELRESLNELLKQQFNLRMQQATGQLGTIHQVKQVRRDVARLKTVINQKEKGTEK